MKVGWLREGGGLICKAGSGVRGQKSNFRFWEKLTHRVSQNSVIFYGYVSKEAALDAPTTQLKTVSQRKIYFHKRSIDNSMDINPAFPLAYYDDVETGLLYNPKPSSKPKSKTESRNVALAECEDQEKFLSDICHKAYYNKVGLAKHIELKFHLR